MGTAAPTVQAIASKTEIDRDDIHTSHPTLLASNITPSPPLPAYLSGQQGQPDDNIANCPSPPPPHKAQQSPLSQTTELWLSFF